LVRTDKRQKKDKRQIRPRVTYGGSTLPKKLIVYILSINVTDSNPLVKYTILRLGFGRFLVH
jgi:hypothetical protein